MSYKIREATLKDVSILKELENTWDEHEVVSGESTPNNYFEMCILEGDLPPIDNPSFENYELYIVEYKNQPIGFFDLYLGYPTDLSAWISIFVIDKNHRGRGHGKYVIDFVEDKVKNIGFTNISIAVDLKNYSGLKFWTKIGFTEVLGVWGDNKYSPKNYAVIGLRRDII